ncbi:MAG TPA: hypothetical protein VFV50_09635 [Bdellovibrionales bacterium]|nr:hypothetical protein [Bdellovibrionales bacterium]
MHFRAHYFASLFLVLAACGASLRPTQSNSSVSISGRASAGPIDGGQVTAYLLLAGGARGAALASATTNAEGLYTIELPRDAGAVELVVTGGTYFEEATGLAVALGSEELSVLISDVADYSVASITPLTAIAASRSRELADAGGDLVSAIESGKREVEEAAGVDDLYAIPANPETSLASEPNADPKYALVLAGLSQLGADYGTSSLSVMSALADDFTDGAFDGLMGADTVGIPNTNAQLKANTWTNDLSDAMDTFVAGPQNGAGFGSGDKPDTIADPDVSVPVELPTPSPYPIVAQDPKISVGSYHACLLKDGALKCWGENDYGQLGAGHANNIGDDPGEVSSSLEPVDVGTGRTVKVAALSAYSTCALLDNGHVKCWGANWFGNLGYEDGADRGDEPGEMGDNLPYLNLGAGRKAKSLVAGASHFCAILDNDKVKCWGNGSMGQLSDGQATQIGDEPNEMGDLLPYVDLGTERTAKQISAGHNSACAVLDTDQVKCWGSKFISLLSSGTTNFRGDEAGESGDDNPVIDFGTGRTVKSVAAFGMHACAILDDDSMKCWGSDSFGVLGSGLPTIPPIYLGDELTELGDNLPVVNVGTGRTVKALAGSTANTCVILDNDRLKCFGSAAYGALGNGDLFDDLGNEASETGDGLPYVDLGTGATVVSVDSGSGYSCALLGDSTVKCWGKNTGTLGLGDTLDRGDEPGEMGDSLPALGL